MRVEVDRDRCVGCGLCERICPEVFEIDEGGKARSKVEVVPPELEEACLRAVDQCPLEGIAVHRSAAVTT